MCEENFETAKVAFRTGGLAGQQRDTRARARAKRENEREARKMLRRKPEGDWGQIC